MGSEYQNAQYIYNYCVSRRFTPEATCGMIGNFQAESSVQPDIWQYGMPQGDLKLGTALRNGPLLPNSLIGAMHMGITGQLWKGSVPAYITK